MREVYESEFKERIPLTSEHYTGVTQEILEKRIEALCTGQKKEIRLAKL